MQRFQLMEIDSIVSVIKEPRIYNLSDSGCIFPALKRIFYRSYFVMVSIHLRIEYIHIRVILIVFFYLKLIVVYNVVQCHNPNVHLTSLLSSYVGVELFHQFFNANLVMIQKINYAEPDCL